MSICPKFRVGDKVRWGKKKGEVAAICLRGDNVLSALQLKVKSFSDYSIKASIISAEDRYVIKRGATLEAFDFREFDKKGRLDEG